MPIISLEILHLSSTPTRLISSAPVISPPIMPGDKKPIDRSDVENYFRGKDLGEPCRRVIRDAIRKKVKATAAHAAVIAKIPELEIEIADENGADAADAAVSGALETLKLIRTHSERTLAGADRYNDFFGGLADTIFFDSNQARSAVAVLGPQVVKGSAIIFELRRERTSTIIQLPQNSSKIAFKSLARQLREDPQDLILLLMGLLEYK